MLSFFPRGVLDEILNLIESVSEGFPSYSPPPPLLFHCWPSQGGTSALVPHDCSFICLWSASIGATYIAVHFALCRAL